MKTMLGAVLLLQILLLVFLFGYHQQRVEAAYKAGADSVPKCETATKDPAQWWFGEEDKTKARKKLCGK